MYRKTGTSYATLPIAPPLLSLSLIRSLTHSLACSPFSQFFRGLVSAAFLVAETRYLARNKIEPFEKAACALSARVISMASTVVRRARESEQTIPSILNAPARTHGVHGELYF